MNTLRKFLTMFLLVAVLAAIGAGTMFTYKGYQYYQQALSSMSPDEMSAAIRSTPDYTPLDQIPKLYQKALITIEDKRFYSHPGIDLIAIGRALYNDIKALAFVEGGSTITQQLAKNQYFSQDKDLTRKVAEVFMSLELERTFTKDEILELYINSIYYGDGYYGIAEAASGYFGKSPAALTDSEMTLLVGIPNAPSSYSPTANPALSRQRQQQVVDQLTENGLISYSKSGVIISQQ